MLNLFPFLFEIPLFCLFYLNLSHIKLTFLCYDLVSMFLLVQFLREEPFKDFATLDHCLEPDLNFLKKANLIIHVLLLDTSFLYQLVYGILNTLYLIILCTHCNQVLVECCPLDDSF